MAEPSPWHLTGRPASSQGFLQKSVVYIPMPTRPSWRAHVSSGSSSKPQPHSFKRGTASGVMLLETSRTRYCQPMVNYIYIYISAISTISLVKIRYGYIWLICLKARNLEVCGAAFCVNFPLVTVASISKDPQLTNGCIDKCVWWWQPVVMNQSRQLTPTTPPRSPRDHRWGPRPRRRASWR